MSSLVSRRDLVLSAVSACGAARLLLGQETGVAGPITPMPERSKSAPVSHAEVPPNDIPPTSSGTDPTFSAGVRVVNVFATVRDESGAIVRNLNKEDFSLSEDGRPQDIKYFSRESNLPLTIGFLLDTSGSTRAVLPEEKSASRQFLEQVLREQQDQAFVVHFDHEVELLGDLTHSRPKLERALDEVETNKRGGSNQGTGSGNSQGWPGRGRGRGGYGQQRGAGGTLFFDAVLLAADEVMRKETGRKALIVLSDGGDRGSKTTMTKAVAAAQRADTLIYSVFFKGDEPGGYGRGGGHGGYGRGGNGRGGASSPIDIGKNAMTWMARETGGSFFAVSADQPVNRAFAQIEQELRSQYSLGYTSDSTSEGKDFRTIAVNTRRTGLVVHARTGYYPG